METLQIDLKQYQKEYWSKEETRNAEIVVDFVQNIMNNHNFEYIREKYGNHSYKQHNQSMSDGLSGVLKVIGGYAKRFPEYAYDVKHIYVDGSFVTLHSHATMKKKHRGNPKKGLNIMDTWKVENGELMEHWDAVQPIHGAMRFLFWMIGGKFRNSNTYF